MKKLMIALAVIAMAAGVQAGAVNWYWSSTVYDGYNNTDEEYTAKAQPGTMYIFNEGAVSRQAALTAILGGTDISALVSMSSYDTSDGKMSSANAKSITSDYTTITPYRDVEGTRYVDYYYAMVVDDYVYISQHFEKGLSDTADTALYGNIGAQSKNWFGDETTIQTTGGWYAIPEPTSGLLLLLGVAGLALRRRRA